MSRWSLLALMLGLLLVAAPFAKQSMVAASEEYDEGEGEEGGAADEEEKDVVVLTTKNWDSIVPKSKFALVEFYAPWCGHCKSLKPHYAKAATILKASSPDVVIAKVDATVESDLGTKFGVQGYPTLKWFVDGELATDYNGGRDADGIVSWIKKKTGPPAITVESASALTELEAQNPIMVVGFFKAFEGDAYKAFKAVGAKTEDVVFVETTSAEVAKLAGLVEADTVAALKNFEGEGRELVPLVGEVTEESIKALAAAEKMPLSIEFSQQNSDKIFNSGINKQLILWAKAADLAADSAVMAAYRTASKAHKGKLVFVTANNEGDSADPITNFFGLKGAEGPVLLGFYMEKNRKFRLHKPLTAESILDFAVGVAEGTAEAEFKSAPIPEDPLDSDVYVVVGKSVEAVVKDPTKDVLLEVYAPWCGHCKKLDPIYKKLAKRFKKVPSVVIAKMDGTENEHPDIEVKGFPTIMLFPAGADQKPIVMEQGDRSLKGLTKFIKMYATVPYELPKKGEEGGDTGTSEDADKPHADKDEL